MGGKQGLSQVFIQGAQSTFHRPPPRPGLWGVVHTKVSGTNVARWRGLWWAGGPLHVHWAEVAATGLFTPCCAARRANGCGGVHGTPHGVVSSVSETSGCCNGQDNRELSAVSMWKLRTLCLSGGIQIFLKLIRFLERRFQHNAILARLGFLSTDSAQFGSTTCKSIPSS